MQGKKTKSQLQQEAARLRKLRATLGLSTREFGKLFGRSNATISQWENAVTEMPEIGLRLLTLYEKEHAQKLKKKSPEAKIDA